MSINKILFLVATLFAFGCIECLTEDFSNSDQLVGRWYMTEEQLQFPDENLDKKCAFMDVEKTGENTFRIRKQYISSGRQYTYNYEGIRFSNSTLNMETKDKSLKRKMWVRLYKEGTEMILMPSFIAHPLLIFSRNKESSAETREAILEMYSERVRYYKISNNDCSWEENKD